jgi:hypothetical protein
VAEGAYELLRPYASSARIPSVSPTDTGVVVDTVLKGGKKYHGKVVAVYSEWISDKEKLEIWAESKLVLWIRMSLLVVKGLQSD